MLAEEQAALRRVATLVARGVPTEEVFAAVTEEAARLLSVEYAYLGRYEPDATLTSSPAVGSPIIVDGPPVGVMAAGSILQRRAGGLITSPA